MGHYAWNATTNNYSWCSREVAQSGADAWGVFFDIPVNGTSGTPAGQLGFIINNCANGQKKTQGLINIFRSPNTPKVGLSQAM